jgi:hypothetical protein
MTNNKATWIGPEQDAYNTRNGGHSRSNRRAIALCPDGKTRTFTCGIPDTFFTIPAHGKINGFYVVGYLSIDDNDRETVLFNTYKE